ncbi:MAG: glycosyltransferase [Ferruginibacter sp.]
MNEAKINITVKKPRVLVAPLDWGLGHATRCISIVYALQNLGLTVVLAGDNAIETILKKEFPNCEFLHLKGYNIRYSRKKYFFMLKLMSQLKRIGNSIQHEQLWLRKVVTEHQINAVVSDNRPGLYHPNVPCIYITHQLQIKTGTAIGNIIASALHRYCIHRFSGCWVPDQEKAPGLAGKLSHPVSLPKTPIQYIGNLSRFKYNNTGKKKGICILLSGPEPQRTLLEQMIIPQLSDLPGPICLVRGLPDNKETLELPPHIQCFSHLPTKDLNELLNETAMVICRSGYSTVMDLVKLRCNAIMIPTPGQGEQVYLGSHLMKAGIFYCCDQKKLNLKKALKSAADFYKNTNKPSVFFNDQPIKRWVEELLKQHQQQ